MTDSILIDGSGPISVVRPANRGELAEIIRAAWAAASALYPVGGGASLDLGNPPTRPGHAVDLRALSRVIDFPARDMTVTVEAGITVAALQRLLAPENLQLPIDVLRGDEATVGGIVAANVSGPRRFGYGTLRDYVIGICAMNDEGREFKAGGRVVKNVAGYDLCKLLVGSLGTLGIITQVTFKLKPLPDARALVVVACPPGRLEPALERVHISRTRPVAVEAYNTAAAKDIWTTAGLSGPLEPWTILALFEGNRAAVDWQVHRLTDEMHDASLGVSATAYPGAAGEKVWNALTHSGEAVIRFKANMLPSATAKFCDEASRLASPVVLRAHAGSGIVLGELEKDWTLEKAAALLGAWRELAARAHGRVIVERCPPAWKSVLSVWGPIGGDAWLMREVKEKFDPRSVFNPGRFYHGI